jgi:hypothetical protein
MERTETDRLRARAVRPQRHLIGGRVLESSGDARLGRDTFLRAFDGYTDFKTAWIAP